MIHSGAISRCNRPKGHHILFNESQLQISIGSYVPEIPDILNLAVLVDEPELGRGHISEIESSAAELRDLADFLEAGVVTLAKE